MALRTVQQQRHQRHFPESWATTKVLNNGSNSKQAISTNISRQQIDTSKRRRRQQRHHKHWAPAETTCTQTPLAAVPYLSKPTRTPLVAAWRHSSPFVAICRPLPPLVATRRHSSLFVATRPHLSSLVATRRTCSEQKYKTLIETEVRFDNRFALNKPNGKESQEQKPLHCSIPTSVGNNMQHHEAVMMTKSLSGQSESAIRRSTSHCKNLAKQTSQFHSVLPPTPLLCTHHQLRGNSQNSSTTRL